MESERIDLPLILSRDEVGNVRTFVFETMGLQWIAGQNQGYILPSAGDTEEENQRWFTISSAPMEGTVNISTRVSSSAFKQALNAMKPGDKITTHSLGGKFVWEEENDVPVTLVAAGIGITPFRSILLERHAAGKSLNATLLYFNRTNEIPFQDELDKLVEKHPEFHMKVMFAEPVTAAKILSFGPALNEQLHYLSGPEPMVTKIGAELKEAGIKVKLDRFPGYDEGNF